MEACCAEAAQEERKQEAARRRKKDHEVADKMRLLSEARQLVEAELERRIDGLERQVIPAPGCHQTQGPVLQSEPIAAVPAGGLRDCPSEHTGFGT